MGLWFWKPDETVNPQQPLSAQLDGQGDPGEGWSQSRSATPASLSDSYGGSGVCSFDAPNRSDGMPDLLFGMDVQLYGSWSQVGKVTDADTDGDYTSYNVDDVLARFNKQVKIAPLAVGYTSPIQSPPTIDDPRQGEPDWETTQAGRAIGVDDRGRILQGLWRAFPGGKTDLYGSPNWSRTGNAYYDMTVSSWTKSYIYELFDYRYISRFDPDTGYQTNYVDAGSLNVDRIAAYRDEALYAFLGDSEHIDVTVYSPELDLVRTFGVDPPSMGTTPTSYYTAEYAVDESDGTIYVASRWREDAGGPAREDRLVVYRFDDQGTILGSWTWTPQEPGYEAHDPHEYMGSLTVTSQGPVFTTRDARSSGGAQYFGPLVRVYSLADLSGPTFIYDRGASGLLAPGLAWHEQMGMLIVGSGLDEVNANLPRSYRFALLEPPTLRQAYFLYMLEAGVPLDIAIDNSSVFDEEVSYPDWEGSLLDKLVELATVTRTQFSPGTLPGTIVVEEIGGTMHKQLPQAMGGKPSLSLGTGQAVDSYTVVSQQARVVTPDSPEVVWDARVENELIQFGLSEVKKVTLETPHSLTSVVMPVRGLQDGGYAVADSEGANITDAFEDAGGYVRATVNPNNPRAIDVEVFSGRGSIGANRPYSLGYRQTTNGQVIPRFSILGSGIFLDPQEATIWTGADPSFTTGGNGPRYESEFISNWDDAYSAANKISSMSVTPSMDVSLSVPDGVERGTGNVGDRFEHNHGVWRLMSVTTDGYTAQWQLQPSTTVGDHDERWAGAKVSDHDSFWDGRTVQDVRVRPLWSDWEPYTGEPIFLKLDDDETPYWTLDPPPEAWVMVDSEDGPYWTPQNGPGTKVIKLDVDGKPYYIDEEGA